jgi:hypothetical protein
VGDNQTGLLKKIGEFTLYLLQREKEIKELEAKLNAKK